MTSGWTVLQKILGRHIPDDPAITSAAEKARREALLKETQDKARVAEAVARIIARDRG
jgi:hypothetical protein